jgi:hypothetical protein
MMPHITTCTICGNLYEANSEEQANEPPPRYCRACQKTPTWSEGIAVLADLIVSLNERAVHVGEQLRLRERDVRAHNPAIPARVPLSDGWVLGWDRLRGGDWGFVAARGDDDEGRPVYDAPRAVRIEAARSLQSLLDELTRRTREVLREDEDRKAR